MRNSKAGGTALVTSDYETATPRGQGSSALSWKQAESRSWEGARAQSASTGQGCQEHRRACPGWDVSQGRALTRLAEGPGFQLQPSMETGLTNKGAKLDPCPTPLQETKTGQRVRPKTWNRQAPSRTQGTLLHADADRDGTSGGVNPEHRPQKQK